MASAAKHPGILIVFLIHCLCVLPTSSKSKSRESTPTPAPWPPQFYSLLYMNVNGSNQIIDLWYDWPKGRNLNIIQNQLGKRLYDLEWNNGTSFFYTLDSNQECETKHFEVGILRPNWLDGAHYLGQRQVDGFLCNVWEKVDFIWYYEDVVTKRPVHWRFFNGMSAHVMTFEVGAVREDEKWQAPVYCFEKVREGATDSKADHTFVDKTQQAEGKQRNQRRGANRMASTTKHPAILIVFLFIQILWLLPPPASSKSTESSPTPAPWPPQFYALLYRNVYGSNRIVDVWYDWPKRRMINIMQYQLGKLLYDVEWNNGTSFYFTLDSTKECVTRHFEVGVLPPDWLDGAHYLGQRHVDGFLCNVWEKADFLWYYEDVVTKRPVHWRFYDGLYSHVLKFEEGAVLEDEKWQAPVHCFEKGNTEGATDRKSGSRLESLVNGVLRGIQ